jgi:Tfp pilus assembly protein PilF
MWRGGCSVPVFVLLVLPMAACNLSSPSFFLADRPFEPARSVPDGGYLDLGRALLQRGDFKEAQDAFIRSIRLEGQTVAALSGAGVAAEKQGLLSEARRYFELAVAAQPGSVIAHNNLGAVLYKMGDYTQAKQAFQAAFALSSGENDVAARNLAITQQAIRREYAESLEQQVNPATLQRLGSGEYKLQHENKKSEKSDG